MRWTRRRLAAAVAVGITLPAYGCDDEEGTLGRQDRTPPSVTIELPAEDSVVNTSRPTFVIRASDAGSGLVVGSINAVINPPGTDVSEFFTNGFRTIDENTAEIRVNGQFPLEDGSRTLVFRIQDEQGNTTTVSATFLVNTEGGGGTP